MSEIDSTAIQETFFQHRTFEKSTKKESTLEKLREKPKSEDGFGKKPKNIVIDGDLWDNEIDEFSLDAGTPYKITLFKQVLNNINKAPEIYPFDIHLYKKNSKIALYEK